MSAVSENNILRIRDAFHTGNWNHCHFDYCDDIVSVLDEIIEYRYDIENLGDTPDVRELISDIKRLFMAIPNPDIEDHQELESIIDRIGDFDEFKHDVAEAFGLKVLDDAGKQVGRLRS